MNTVVFADGTTADRYAQLVEAGRDGAPASATPRAARLPSGEPNISGDWAPEQLVMTDPRGRDGALVPVSQVEQFQPGERPNKRGGAARTARARTSSREAGKKASESFNGHTRDNPRMRCETTSILFDWTFDGPVNRITQSGDTITLQYGQLGFTRTIHLNAEHPASDRAEPRRALDRPLGERRARRRHGRVRARRVVAARHEQRASCTSSSASRSIRPRSRSRAPTPRRIPLYFTGEYTGTDTIGVADLPYAPDKCKELTFVDFSNDGTAPGGVASTPLPGAAGAPAPARRGRGCRAAPARRGSGRAEPAPSRSARRSRGGSSGNGGTDGRLSLRAPDSAL